MTSFWIGLVIGTTFGLALAILLSRLAGSAKWIAGLFGYSDDRRKIREMEKRLAEKDRYIKKAIEAYGQEGSKETEPEEKTS